MVKILIFIYTFFLFIQNYKIDGFLLQDKEDLNGKTKEVFVDQETCTQEPYKFVGLLPGAENCEVFWLCRKSTDPNKTVEVEQFRCDDVDETKPYYDADTCQCVSTNGHCGRNNDIEFRLKCVHVLNEEEAVETCRGFGYNASFYENHFINFENPHKFWFCRPNEFCSDGKDVTTMADEFDCPSGLWYNMHNCSCDYNSDVDLLFNHHPMNRFKCAKPFVVSKDQETCQDDQNRYYEGLFVFAENPHYFWECTVKNESTTSLMSVSHAELQKCESSDTYFNIETCECSTEQPKNNSNGEYRYNCASLLDVEEEDEPCRDSNGLYHIGDIPDVTDCSKYLTCVPNSDSATTSPVQRNCHYGLFFNVLSNFNGHCGCDRPENFNCQDNHKPENKFLCARDTAAFEF